LSKSLQLSDRDCFAFSIAGLLHDIGHGPLSHVWEECWAAPRKLSHFHEKIGYEILTSGKTEIGTLLARADTHKKFQHIGKDVVAFTSKQHRLTYLLPLLAGNLDVDRLDFMARDTRSAGVTYGFHDLDWIIRSFRFARLPAKYIEREAPRW